VERGYQLSIGDRKSV